MKIKLIILILPCVLSGLILTSCQSHESNADDAFNQVKEEKMLEKDSNGNYYEIMKEPDTIPVERKKETLDEWSIFSMAMEKKIKANETKIKQIKSMPNASVKTFKKVRRLEDDNNYLKIQMAKYRNEWESFKTNINKDADGLASELNDLSKK